MSPRSGISPLGRLAFWLAIAGVALAAVGAKWQLIRQFGSDVPYMDQWNGEATPAIQPWLDGAFDLGTAFWSPHNEHRIGWTRLWALGLTLLNGQWDPLFATTINAIVHVAILAGILLLLRPLLAGPGWWLGPAVAAATLCAPLAWENTIAAFQVQFYFVVAAGVAHLALVPRAGIRSWRWWVGLAAGVAGLASMSSAFLAPAAAIGVRLIRAWQRRRWSVSDTVTIAACAALVAAGVASITPVPGHEPLHAPDAGTFFSALAHIAAYPAHAFWPFCLLLQAPLAWWAWTRARRFRDDWMPAEWFLLGFVAWLVLTVAALAYARGNFGHGISPRYADTFSLLLLANAAAMGALWLRGKPGRRTPLVVLAGAWALVVAGGIARDSRRQLDEYLRPFPERWEEYGRHVREFVAGGDDGRLRSVPTERLPFISHDVMIDVLRDPGMRRVLPAGVRAPAPFAEESQSGFDAGIPGNLPPPDDAGGVHGSTGEATSSWRSVPVPVAELLPILRMTFAGDPRLPTRALRLETDDGREALLEIGGFNGHAWQSAHLFIPGGARTVRLVAEAGPDGKWLAFAPPVELGFGSWLTHQLRKESKTLLWAGLILLAGGLALSPPGKRRAAPGGEERESAAETTDGPPAPGGGSRASGSAWVALGREAGRALAAGWAAIQRLPVAAQQAGFAALLILLASVVFAGRPGTGRLVAHLAAAVLTLAALGLPTLVFAAWLRARTWMPPSLVALTAGAGTCGLGLLAFWAWFPHPVSGWVFSIGVAGWAGWWLRRNGRSAAAVFRDEDFRTPLAIMVLVGAFTLGALHLPAIEGNVDVLAADRFVHGLPVDNQIPRFFAERLAANESPRLLTGDWLSSDRPPLQTGVILLAWPWFRAAGLDAVTGAHAASFWFQLLWVPAAWALARSLALSVPACRAIVALTAFNGVMLLHAVYVWPKLGAAALVVGAFVHYFAEGGRGNARVAVAGGLAGLAWLAHGGSAFSLAALAVLALVSRPRPGVLALAAGVAAFAFVVGPWMAYQKYYEPPGNRLLKWHLAGVIPPDNRGTMETLGRAYGEIGMQEMLSNKAENVRQLVTGDWRAAFSFNPATADARRVDEFFHFARAVGPNLLLLALVPWVWWREGKRAAGLSATAHARVLAWVALSLLVWVVLMFGPGTTSIHQGSLATHLALFPALFAAAWTTSRWFFAVVAFVQVASFVLTWLPANAQAASAPVQPVAFTLFAFALAGLFLAATRDHGRRPPGVAA